MNNKRTTHTRVLVLLLSLLLVMGAFAGCGGNGGSSGTGSAPASSQAVSSAADSAPASSQAGSTASGAENGETKSIAFTVVHGDGSKKEFPIETTADNLRAALEEQNLIAGEESEYGLFVKTVDGETVNDANEEWWCLTDKDGNSTPTGVDDTKIADGDAYTFTFTVGY